MSQANSTRSCANPACGKSFEPPDARSKYCNKRCLFAVQNARTAEKRIAAREGRRPAVPVGPRRMPEPTAAPSRLQILLAPLPPWATPALCAAIRRGMGAPSAVKEGRFVVVRDNDKAQSLLVHVPTERLTFPRERIVLIATLNERARWSQRPAGEGVRS